jgi:hypothetical protein
LKPNITAFMSEWHHTTTKSFYACVHDVLSHHLSFETVVWDCKNLPQGISTDNVLLFLQFLPPRELLENPKARIVWIPMWDNMVWYPYQWWDQLPQNIRIVSFSKKVEEFARRFNYANLTLQYFKNPSDFPAVDWNQGRTMFYRNRKGHFSPGLLRQLCQKLDIETFFFLSSTDPDADPGAAFDLPAKMGDTHVQQINGFLSSREYLDLLSRSQVFLAPRKMEGIGMIFLEAMASGSAVIASDAPTMNEYIRQGENGFLLRPTVPHLIKGPRRKWDKLLKLRLRKLYGALFARQRFWFDFPFDAWQHFPLDETTDISCLLGANLEQVGKTARASHLEGYQHWLSCMPEYARFISEW